MITWEEYKELVTKYNLVTNSYNASMYSLPYFSKYGKYQGKLCAVYNENFGIKISRDLECWYTWLIAKEDVEVALNKMFKFLKAEQVKEKLNNARSDFV